MIPRYAEARRAMAAALEVRRRVGLPFDQPVAIVDIALKLGLLVWFSRLASLEGLWCKEKRTIVLTSLRPAGRRSFTCAHEIGHCEFNHGTRLDKLLEYRVRKTFNPVEYLANEFAAHLLMPFSAISLAIQNRRWDGSRLDAVQIYTLASQFGVSYGALLNHLRHNLKIIRDDERFRELSRVSPKSLRAVICPRILGQHMVMVDEFWQDRPIDLEVGDILVLPRETRFETGSLKVLTGESNFGITASAATPAVGDLFLPNGSQVLYRIAEREFEGFAEYRFPDQNNVYGRS